MMKRKARFNQELLNEELKRHMFLNEYSFYVPENKDEYDDTENLILGEEPEGDEMEAGAEVDAAAGDEMEAGAEVDAGAEAGAEDLGGEEPIDGMDDLEAGDDMDLGGEDLGAIDEPADDEIEIDVTQLVQGTEEAKASADMANSKMEDLMNQFNQLQSKLDDITNSVATKVEDLENEVEKRMPTPEEKLEMRSLDSYPYNLKLTDYWADKRGQYNVMGDEEEGDPKEYVLTGDDIDADYNETDVRDSFSSDYDEDEL